MTNSTPNRRVAKLTLADQPPCGILGSLIARLVLENQREGLAVLVDALHYLNGGATVSC